jgi:hypothetical protein
MSDSDELPLLNVFEVEANDGGTRHLLAFVETDLAGSNGLPTRSIVGEISPTEDGGYDSKSLRLNPEFVEALTGYMNAVQATTPEITEQARKLPSGWFYIIDPRFTEDSGTEPSSTDIVGAFAVDDAGHVVPGSFHYNDKHAMIDQVRGMTGLFSDRRFYDWMHGSR